MNIFIAATQGWKIKSSIVEFKNILAGRETLDKQMGEASLMMELHSMSIMEAKISCRMVPVYLKNDDKMEGSQGKERTRGTGGLKNHCGKKV